VERSARDRVRARPTNRVTDGLRDFADRLAGVVESPVVARALRSSDDLDTVRVDLEFLNQASVNETAYRCSSRISLNASRDPDRLRRTNIEQTSGTIITLQDLVRARPKRTWILGFAIEQRLRSGHPDYAPSAGRKASSTDN